MSHIWKSVTLTCVKYNDYHDLDGNVDFSDILDGNDDDNVEEIHSGHLAMDRHHGGNSSLVHTSSKKVE